MQGSGQIPYTVKNSSVIDRSVSPLLARKGKKVRNTGDHSTTYESNKFNNSSAEQSKFVGSGQIIFGSRNAVEESTMSGQNNSAIRATTQYRSLNPINRGIIGSGIDDNTTFIPHLH